MINPLKATYVKTKDETTIWYEETEFRKRKPIEKFIIFKGRLKVKPTIDNMTKLIEEKTK